MKKIFSLVILILAVATLIYLVDDKFYTTKSYIYKISDSEKVKVSMQIKDGYKLDGKNFTIETTAGDTLTSGEFIESTLYYSLLDQINNSSNVRVIESSKTDTFEYTFYAIDEKSFIYLIKMIDNDIYLALTNNVSVESAVKVFNRFSIEIA